MQALNGTMLAIFAGGLVLARLHLLSDAHEDETDQD